MGNRIGRAGKLLVTVVAVAGIFLAPLSHALEQKGTAGIDYGSRLDGKEKQATLDEALRNAVEIWVAEEQSGHYKNYEKVKSNIDADIHAYVLNHQLIAEDDEEGRYDVVVRANLNEPKLLAEFLSWSEPGADAEDQFLTFVFVAREEVGTVSKTEKEASQTKERTQGVEKERANDSASQTKSQTQTIRNNTTETKINDQALWDVTTANEIDVAMGDVFTDADYLVIDAAFLEEETGYLLSVEKFVEDYRSGDDLSAVRRS